MVGMGGIDDGRESWSSASGLWSEDERRKRLPSDEERWAALRALWQSLPEPEWTEERSEAVFARIMDTLERKKQRGRWAFVASAGLLPLLPIVSALTRRRR